MIESKFEPDNFKNYIGMKNRVIGSFSCVLISLYILFNLVIVFAPDVFNATFSTQLPIPVGIFIGLGLIVLFGVVTIAYALFSSKFLDPLIEHNLNEKL